MQGLIQDTIKADSVVDTLGAVLESAVKLPPRDTNLMLDMSQVFGSLASKCSCFVDSHSYQVGDVLPLSSVVLFLFVAIIYLLVIGRYPKEISSVFKIIIFPTLFNKTHEVNSVHLKHYLTYVFIFSVIVITILSWIYIANGDIVISISTYLYFAFKGGFSKLMGIRQGRNSPISRLTYFIVSFYTTTSLIFSPVVLASLVFGPTKILYIFIITVLSSYYIFIGRYFYREKFSFKQFLLYLCTAEVIPLALIICLFYTKIIAFGN